MSEQKYIISENDNSNEYDVLTGLLSRNAFEKKISEISSSKTHTDFEHAFIYIDIDYFKVVNDLHGHNAGDSLICAISTIINSKIRRDDIFARLGGDEFGLIIKDCNLKNAERMAHDIRNAIKSHTGIIEDDFYKVSASIGIVMMDKKTKDISDLYRKADIACFTAKGTGRDKIKLYQDDDHKITMHSDDMQWYKKISNSLENNEFTLYAQSIIPLAMSKMINERKIVEVLLRMKGSDGELITPGKFMAAANRYGISTKIDQWVIGSLIEFLNKNRDVADEFSLISVNLSGQSLGDLEVMEFLIEKLKSLEIEPSVLCFEITETEAIANMSEAINFINNIKNKFGCQFALDDFGSGFSSFRYIKLLPIDIVKVDGSFILDVLNDPVSRIVIQAVNGIAKVSNKKTIAEWVENEEILDEVQHLGFNYCQGHYFGEPQPLDDFTDVLHRANM